MVKRSRKLVKRHVKAKNSIKPTANTVYSFIRLVKYADTSVGSSDLNVALTVKLSDFPNYTEFTNLFEYYRITKVTVMIRPSFDNWLSTNNSLTAPFQNGYMPYITHAIDLNDGATSTETALLQYENVKITKATSPITRSFKPANTTSVYAGNFTSAYDIQKDQWISTTNANAEYYGWKATYASAGSSLSTNYRFYVKAVIQCKASK